MIGAPKWPTTLQIQPPSSPSIMTFYTRILTHFWAVQQRYHCDLYGSKFGYSQRGCECFQQDGSQRNQYNCHSCLDRVRLPWSFHNTRQLWGELPHRSPMVQLYNSHPLCFGWFEGWEGLDNLTRRKGNKTKWAYMTKRTKAERTSHTPRKLVPNHTIA